MSYQLSAMSYQLSIIVHFLKLKVMVLEQGYLVMAVIGCITVACFGGGLLCVLANAISWALWKRNIF